MTEFEKAIEPYEKWVNDKLSQVVPSPEKVTRQMCAAMIAQYHIEIVQNGLLSDVVESIQNVKSALNASVSAIYFADNSDYLGYHYDVIRSLTNVDEPSDEYIKKLFEEMNPE